MKELLTNIDESIKQKPNFKGYMVKVFLYALLAGVIIGSIIAILPFEGFIAKNEKEVTPTTQSQEESYKGKIRYIDSNFYPNDKINFELISESGEVIILLKAKDQILEVSEGQYVEVFGQKMKTQDGSKDILMVSKVVFSEE